MMSSIESHCRMNNIQSTALSVAAYAQWTVSNEANNKNTHTVFSYNANVSADSVCVGSVNEEAPTAIICFGTLRPDSLLVAKWQRKSVLRESSCQRPVNGKGCTASATVGANEWMGPCLSSCKRVHCGKESDPMVGHLIRTRLLARLVQSNCVIWMLDAADHAEWHFLSSFHWLNYFHNCLYFPFPFSSFIVHRVHRLFFWLGRDSGHEHKFSLEFKWSYLIQFSSHLTMTWRMHQERK